MKVEIKQRASVSGIERVWADGMDSIHDALVKGNSHDAECYARYRRQQLLEGQRVRPHPVTVMCLEALVAD